MVEKKLKIQPGQKTKEVKRSNKHKIMAVDKLHRMLRSARSEEDKREIESIICEVTKI